jgi:hypothetical protein
MTGLAGHYHIDALALIRQAIGHIDSAPPLCPAARRKKSAICIEEFDR